MKRLTLVQVMEAGRDAYSQGFRYRYVAKERTFYRNLNAGKRGEIPALQWMQDEPTDAGAWYHNEGCPCDFCRE